MRWRWCKPLPEDHGIGMLALNLIQGCMIQVNTLMIQNALAQPHWRNRSPPPQQLPWGGKFYVIMP